MGPLPPTKQHAAQQKNLDDLFAPNVTRMGRIQLGRPWSNRRTRPQAEKTAPLITTPLQRQWIDRLALKPYHRRWSLAFSQNSLGKIQIDSTNPVFQLSWGYPGPQGLTYRLQVLSDSALALNFQEQVLDFQKGDDSLLPLGARLMIGDNSQFIDLLSCRQAKSIRHQIKEALDFFDLDPDTTNEKALIQAKRKFAKKNHPDRFAGRESLFKKGFQYWNLLAWYFGLNPHRPIAPIFEHQK